MFIAQQDPGKGFYAKTRCKFTPTPAEGAKGTVVIENSGRPSSVGFLRLQNGPEK
jgi:hypothetical protein